MIRQFIAAAVLVPLLSSCAGDVPENVPQYGQWELVRTLDSVTVDGIAFAADELPGDLTELEGTESVCGEPLYIDRDWLAEDLVDRTKGMCTLEDLANTPTTASMTGQCKIDVEGAVYAPAMRGEAHFGPDHTRDVVTMEGTITIDGDPAPHVLKLIAVQESTRTGDC